MRRTRIKICGITNAHDAALAVAAGADAVGVIFAASPRHPTVEQVAEAVAACGLTAVQFSGSELPRLCDAVGVPVLKALHIGTDFDLEGAEPFRGHAAALLLDTYVAGKAGGTSQAFDWPSLGALPGWAPFFIAGGLNPNNVAACIAALHPFAVDVSSGVEASAGIKDPEKITAFCAAVRDADMEVVR